MNQQYDIIVIGDSKCGHAALKQLASANNAIKLAFVSREFKSSTTHDFINVEYIKDEVVFTDYKNRLFGCYLKNGDRLFSTHLIIASGIKYEPFLVDNKLVPCVFNNTNDVPKSAKMQPALVIGHTDTDIKFALDVAKKYKQVYFCSSDFNVNGTAANIKKLTENTKIAILPNTSIARFFSKNNSLEAVELDNYSKVTCSAIYIKTEHNPDTAFVSNKLIDSNEFGYLKISNTCESTVVPKCFAIGNCAEKSTKKMHAAMCKTILNDLKECV